MRPRVGPVFRLGPGGVHVPGSGPVCIGARTWSGARLCELAVACVVSIQLTTDSFDFRSFKAGARGARQALKALTLSHKQSPLCILYSRELACRWRNEAVDYSEVDVKVDVEEDQARLLDGYEPIGLVKLDRGRAGATGRRLERKGLARRGAAWARAAGYAVTTHGHARRPARAWRRPRKKRRCH